MFIIVIFIISLIIFLSHEYIKLIQKIKDIIACLENNKKNKNISKRINAQIITTTTIKKSNKKKKNKSKKSKIKKNKKKCVGNLNSRNESKISKNDSRIVFNNKKNNINMKHNNYNDNELNSLSYEEALKQDKRTYIQFYFSLLRTKHLLFFAFYPNNDYNSIIIKISLFFFIFSLNLVTNALFFTDNTMHKIYEDKGAYDLIYRLNQIIYSSIISLVFDSFLRYLSLSEKPILELKHDKKNKDLNLEYKKIVKKLKIKYYLYFICSFLILFSFWYFISCFCAVYANTQIILIKDTLICFGFSLLYPLGIKLLPGFFRISALKSKDKNKQCLYKFSCFIQNI